MSEPRRSTRTRAREEAAPPPEPPKETPVKGAKSTLKRKRTSVVVKDPTPSTPGTEPEPQGAKLTLPLRIQDGQPLPTLPEPQPLELSTTEWQDIQQSGVLSASLERSRAVWISGVNFRVFHKYFTQPKKPADRTEEDKAKQQRQKDLFKNFPELGKDASTNKDTIEVQAQLVVEPHTFPIRLYAPREIMKQAPKKPNPPPPSPQYGYWPSDQPRHGQPNQYTQYNHHGQPVYQQKPPAPRPPPPKPVQRAPQASPAPTHTPAPDPVIHALAQRAGTDPELKAVMKIVANGSANKQQLEFFQNHIQELTEMLKRKDGTAKTQNPPAPQATSQTLPQTPTPKPNAPPAAAKSTPASVTKAPSQPPAPAPAPPASQPPTTTPASAPVSTPTPKPAPPPAPASVPPPTTTPSPAPRPVPASLPQYPQQLPPQQQPQYPPKPYNSASTQGPMQHPPPVRPNHPPYPNNYGPPHPPQYYPPRQMSYHPPPPPAGYRPLVFSFEEGNKDLLHFPSYSFMEWLPNMSGAKFSFLVTKLKPKPEVDTAVKPLSTPAPNTTPMQPPGVTPNATPVPAVPNMPQTAPIPGTPAPGTPAPDPNPMATPAATVPYVPPPRIEDFDEKNDIADIDFYQPVTVLLLTENNDIRQALLRAIRPSDVVEKYMDEVFDKCKRAEETYLAFRLPRDADAEPPEKRMRSGDGTPAVSTPTQESIFGGVSLQNLEKKKAGRPRKSLV